MRIRSIKPEFWRSDDIARLPWDVRLVYVGLWSYVDDNGVGRDDWRIITAELFALDDPLTEPSLRVREALNTLAAGGQIARYRVDGKSYIEVLAWDQHQVINRPSKPRFPRSTAESAELHGALTEPSVTEQNMPGAGTGEQGNRGTGEQGAEEQSSLSPDESDDLGELIPQEWRPNQTHIDKAASLHLDVTREYHRFRDNAERTHRRLKNWNTGFTNWLRKAAEFNQQRSGTNQPNRAQQRQAGNLAVVSQLAALDNGQMGITA